MIFIGLMQSYFGISCVRILSVRFESFRTIVSKSRNSLCIDKYVTLLTNVVFYLMDTGLR